MPGFYAPEVDAVRMLLAARPLADGERAAVVDEAVVKLVAAAAVGSTKKQGVVEGFLQQFSLGTREGLALMCLAEALLRVPDNETRDRLIAEKIGSADWASHIGKSDSLFGQCLDMGLMLTGRLVECWTTRRGGPGRLPAPAGADGIGEPVIRAGGGRRRQNDGRTVRAGPHHRRHALARAKREKMLRSFDMLGEGARTDHDALRYEHIYAEAIAAVGAARGRRGAGAGARRVREALGALPALRGGAGSAGVGRALSAPAPAGGGGGWLQPQLRH